MKKIKIAKQKIKKKPVNNPEPEMEEEEAEEPHLQSGEHIPWQVVWDSIKDDYKEEDMQWIKFVPWRGPLNIPKDSIDLSNISEWTASKPGPNGTEKVNEMAEKLMNEGWWKPVILINTPADNEKMQVVDGRHRVLAAIKNKMDILAYVGDVGSADKQLDHMKMHGKQVTSKS